MHKDFVAFSALLIKECRRNIDGLWHVVHSFINSTEKATKHWAGEGLFDIYKDNDVKVKLFTVGKLPVSFPRTNYLKIRLAI